MSIVTCRSQVSRGITQLSKQRPLDAVFRYVGGNQGVWRVTNVVNHIGTPLKRVSHVDVSIGPLERIPAGASWMLRGVANNTRYVSCEDRRHPDALSFAGPLATHAALIPIRKSAAWWSLAREQRQELAESHSAQLLRRVQQFIPRWHFNRNLDESFDVITWFEYGPQDASIFDELASAFRASDEWQFVDRAIEIRLERE